MITGGVEVRSRANSIVRWLHSSVPPVLFVLALFNKQTARSNPVTKDRAAGFLRCGLPIKVKPGSVVGELVLECFDGDGVGSRNQCKVVVS